MDPVAKIKNVVGGEVIVRSVTGVILILIAFFISGVTRWVLGWIGAILLLTAIFGY